MQALGRKHGGVRVYMDGFRVFPYGDQTDDWLGIDADRARRLTSTPDYLTDIVGQIDGLAATRPMLLLPQNMHLFGVVAVSRTANPGLELKASREGFIDTSALSNLRKAVRWGINWATVQYARGELRLEKEAAEEGGALAEPDPIESIRQIRDLVLEVGDALPGATRTELLELLEVAERAVTRQQQETVSGLSLLRALASTGIMIAIFEHELGETVSGLRAVRRDLSDLNAVLPAQHRERIESIREDLSRWIALMYQQRELVDVLVGREGREERRPLALREAVDRLKAAFDPYMDDLHIDLSNEVPESLRLRPMFPCEVQSILVNLLTNSVKALLSRKTRRVAVRAAGTPAGVEMLFLGTGGGLPRKRWEEVFDPLVSYSADSPDLVFGTGTGLGLTIVRDTLDTYGGTVQFIDPPRGWQTCVRVFIPKE